MATALVDTLHRLHGLILQERDCAKRLDMDGLNRASEEKSLLLTLLPPMAELTAEQQRLAHLIRQENRRNAYLFWSGLSLVRETMGFFNQQAAAPSYGPGGGTLRASGGGRLLSGKV